MPREARLDIAGLTYHITCRGIERKAIFIDEGDYRYFMRTLCRVVAEEVDALYAFCLMPNHVHLLIKPRTALATCMRRLLTSYAVYFNKRYKRAGHLFQNRYASALVQSGPYFLELIRYIHLNPVRAGVVSGIDSLTSYRYTGYSALMGRKSTVPLAAADVLLCFANNKRHARLLLKAFMYEGISKEHTGSDTSSHLKAQTIADEVNDSRASMIDKRILGDSSFADEVLRKIEEKRDPVAQETRLKKLIEISALYFGISTHDLCSATKNRRIAKARAATIFCGAKRYLLPPKMLADALGVKPSTVYAILRTRKGEHESRNIVLE